MNIREAAPGLESVNVRVDVQTSASPEAIRELHDYVNAHSPIWDSLRRPVSVTSELRVSTA